MANPTSLDLAPLQTPPLVPGKSLIGEEVEYRWHPAWLKYFALLNSFFNGGGGSGSGFASVVAQDVSGINQIITVPFPPPTAGQLMVVRLNTQADPASILWGAEFDPGADIRINPVIGGQTVFLWYGEDRGGLGTVLWYSASAPYMWPAF